MDEVITRIATDLDAYAQTIAGRQYLVGYELGMGMALNFVRDAEDRATAIKALEFQVTCIRALQHPDTKPSTQAGET